MKNSKQSTAMLLLMSLMFGSSNVVFAENQDQLAPITVSGTAETKAQEGKDQVYLRNITNMYHGKETVERYKGSAPADLFQGFNGVYSGDARNSGAVDPNIRGIQGQGRIPVTIDGTEQAITTWRGYNGANNRNYLDPNLISSITIEKGPSIASGNMSGIGGSVKMKTIDVEDILKPGQKFGGELKLETSNNSVKERIPDYSIGEDYRAHGTPDIFGDFSPVSLVEPKKKGKLFKDNAIRLALALKEENFDLLGAYSYRSKGNYLAGKGGYHKYEGVLPEEWGRDLKQLEPNLPFAASVYRPHTEVPNTSSEMKSFLLKGSLKLNKNQNLKAGYRHSDITYGEIMPSRLDFRKFVGWVPQWPLANVKQDAFNLDYAYNPDSPWINLKTGLWYTKTVSDTNTSGGNPREISDAENMDNIWFGQAMQQCYVGYNNDPNVDPHHQVEYDPECMKKIGQEAIKLRPNTNGQYSYVNAAQVNAYNTRKGFHITNTMQLTNKLDLTLSGSFQKEKLTSNHLKEKSNPSSTFETPPRLGRRQEWDVTLNFNYRPTDWLILTAGGRYNEYWSYDDYLAKLLREGKLYYSPENENGSQQMNDKETIKVQKVVSQEDWDERKKLIVEHDRIIDEMAKDPKKPLEEYIQVSPYITENGCNADDWDCQVLLKDGTYNYKDFVLLEDIEGVEKNPNYDNDLWHQTIDMSNKIHSIEENGIYDEEITFDIPYGKDGRVHRKDNPFANGTVKNKLVTNPATGEKELLYKLISVSTEQREIEEKDKLKSVKKERAHAISPSLSATVLLTDNSRAWVRYVEYSRMPSIFETTVGFSASAAPLSTYDRSLKPEKAQNIEIGYAYDFSHLFESNVRSDLKLSYYHNVTKNVIDRDTNFSFIQLNKRTLEGLELQGRFDNGKFFGDLGIEYHLKNQVCDADVATSLDPILQRIPACITAGFPMGYLRTQLQPKYSITANLGARFLHNKLELGTRWLYHSKARNKDEEKIYEIDKNNGYVRGLGLNNPMYWQPVLIIDAYAKYKITKDVDIEFTGTNLTDRYYLDPMTRSMIPAPGRTFKLGLTAKF